MDNEWGLGFSKTGFKIKLLLTLGFAATVLGLVHWAWTPMHFPFVRRLTRWWVQPEWKRKIVIGVTTAKPELLPCTIFILHFCLCGCILDRCPWHCDMQPLGLLFAWYVGPCASCMLCAFAGNVPLIFVSFGQDYSQPKNTSFSILTKL